MTFTRLKKRDYLRKAMPVLLLLMCLGQIVQAQQIKGRVVSETGEPLPGVSIQVKETATGTITDVDGNYTITVADTKASLVFSFMGYIAETVPINDQTTINVTLIPDLKTLDEIVVIGYGSVKKRDLTGPVSNVSAKQIAERQPVTLFDALEGQAAGVLVTSEGGNPFGGGSIQIRGASTINATGNGPLYVIDGVQSDNANFINPSDIESVDILKDAASASIYGARGANGVVIITTKKGKEGKMNITANFTHTIGKLSHKVRTTTADELRYYRTMRNSDFSSGANTDSINPYLNQDNDYQDLLLRTAHKNTLSLSASGGQKGFTYYFGLTYTDDRSIIINSYAKRIQTKLSASYTYSKLKLDNDISFAWETGNEVPVYNTIRMVFDRNPWSSLYRPDGSLTSTIESKRNPVAQATLNINKSTNYTVQNSTQGSYQLFKSLKFTTIFSAKLYVPTVQNLAPAATSTSAVQIANGYNSFQAKFDWSYQAFLNYDKTFAADHSVTGLLAFSADRSRQDKYRIGMNNYLDENVLTSTSATVSGASKDTYTSATANSSASVFGRLSYSYKGRYIVQGSLRHDGSSRFGGNNKWGDFWSASGAWHVSDEHFMEWSKNYIDDWKLRYGFGQAGNDAIGDYINKTYMNFNGNPDNTNEAGSYTGYGTSALSSVMGNPNIQWETTTSQNFGTDLTFLKGRVTFTAEHYIKVTDDLLYTKELPKETGFSEVAINLGSIENKGWEFTLGGTPIVLKDFTWNVTGNISFERPKIKELAGHTSFISGTKWLIQEGGKIGDFYVWKNSGVYQWDESNAYDADGHKLTVVLNNGKPDGSYTLDGQPYSGTVYKKKRNGYTLVGGDTEWQDVDNNGVIDDNDKIIAGNAIPKYYFGLSNTLKYKNFMLSFSFNGQIGKDIYNRIAATNNSNSSSSSPPMWDAILYAWHKQGDVAIYPYAPYKDTHGGMSSDYNSLYIEDGSFIRLASARLSYNLNKNLVNKLKIQTATLFIYGINLATWTNYRMFDPEMDLSGLTQGEDNGKYPKRREIGFGLNLIF